jgi:hypothetical protein
LLDVNVNLSDGASESANEIIDRFVEAGLQIHEIRRMDMSLEDVYFKLIETSGQEERRNRKPKSEEKWHV